MILMNSEIYAEQVVAFLHNEYDSNIHSNDIHYLYQITEKKTNPILIRNYYQYLRCSN